MTDESDYAASKEPSADAAAWCFAGFILLAVIVGIWAVFN